MRLLEVILKEGREESINGLAHQEGVIESWPVSSSEGQDVFKLLVDDEHSGDIIELLENSGARVIIYAVEGILPKPETKPEDKDKIKVGKFLSISKEELYQDIDDPVNLSTNFILMVVLSTLVAGIGIAKGNIAIIIGAMVIAPFLGPNISMAFGTTLGDWSMIRKSAITGLVATGIVLVISVLWGLIFNDISSIARDPDIEYQDVLLALVCGFAGVLSIVGGKGAGLVGVMVAAALLPPLMRSGLLLGAGQYQYALNSILIFATNIVCLNISGIVTFYLGGIRPNKWWEKEKARKHTKRAFLLWGIALLIVLLLIVVIKWYNS